MLRLVLTLPATAALVIIVASAPAAPVPAAAKEGPLYFPTTVGTKWVYAEKNSEWTDVVVAAKEADGRTVVTVHTLDATSKDGKGYLSGVVTVAPDGLHWARTGLMEFDPPLHDLKLPHKDGNKWAVRTTVLRSKYEADLAAFGPEEVKVPAGTFMAIRVEATDPGKAAPRSKTWYAPGVGQVKVVHNNGQNVRVLKSFTPGKK